MAQRGQRTGLGERVEIGERWEAGQSDPEIAAGMDLSVSVVRKWRRRYQKEGRAGLGSHMGRPATGALGTFPAETRQQIREMRERHPGWGPVTIRIELADELEAAGRRIPSRSRIAAYLKQEGLTRQYERHSDLPQPKTRKAERVHEVWEMDAQGVIKDLAIGRVCIINITDVRSRVKVNSYACIGAAHPTMQDYQHALRQAFVRFGLPEQITLDHDCAFYDSSTPSPYPLQIHLWLIGLGIEVRFIKQKPPFEHSIIERSHQTMEAQAITGQDIANNATLYKNLADRKVFMNERYPSRALNGQAPLQAFPEAQHSGRPYRPEWEADLLDMQRVADYLAPGRWFRVVSDQGQFFLGSQRYGMGRHFKNQTIEITFIPDTCELVCVNARADETVRMPAKGVSTEYLMGELSPLMSFPYLQLELPFTPPAIRQLQLCAEMTGTTL